METKYEKENVMSYEVFTHVNGERKLLYITDTLEDLKTVIKQKEIVYDQNKAKD